MGKEKALFLDRDGLICHMVKYPKGFDSAQKVEDVELVSGIEKVISAARSKGFVVIEISNQPGIAKGKQTQELSDAIESRVHELLIQKGVKVDDVYICNHHPKGVIQKLSFECECRKPKPGLLFKAADEHNLDLIKSIFYGDKETDVKAAKSAGCLSMILIHKNDTTEKVEAAKTSSADYKVSSHNEAFEIISSLS